jgi:hypothetical protein
MDNSKICVTSINYDSGRIATCVVSINEKNYTVKWANGKYEVAAGGEVVNCGAATSGAAPVASVVPVPVTGTVSKTSVPVAPAPKAVAPAPKPVETKTFAAHEELIQQLMTDQKLRPV